MPTYNKLVRDRIPEIIQSNGNKINTRILDEDEYKEELQLKLNEELQEYLEAMEDSHAVEELADMLELIYSLVEVHNSSFDELEEVRKEKRQVRGGFNERVYLIDVDD
ncbi:nucleoside triphosphate pyrophosphohydrolase [Guptibacillus hwajinpoensis]|uniref:House-cleaning noncanonical NTP pyrophosphatase (MazG superfamily) n=1 Tax=Guptibacillus hwajinpoensis TaxID=208199 RepID=A0ABU0K3Q1_9BACL|nr:nucleoside triphosphate pyrophosphohydrolase [Alkalihalobacillus hemicentroti]MDQ0483991.1 putative house-cleaning noncanonical NTP pyrophosphatase (MazG superfamily) [Alkalihalobacillus hemicentroti]